MLVSAAAGWFAMNRGKVGAAAAAAYAALKKAETENDIPTGAIGTRCGAPPAAKCTPSVSQRR